MIIEGCIDGNRASQKRLYEHFYAYGISVSLRYSKNREEAVEILNDAFLKVFRFIDRYDSERPFKYWLRRIVVNASIDYQKKNKVKFVTQSLSDIDVPSEEEFTMIEEGMDVLPILQRLSPQYRTVFNLYVFEDYKHDEIAEKLGISVGTSRSNLLRAKSKLKSWLTDAHNSVKAN